MIDAHVHFWKYQDERDTWMDEGIRQDFLPKHLAHLLRENNVDGVVAVQADQSETETNFLCSLAQDYPEILGVVGWINLLDENLSSRLKKYKDQSIIKGWRHIVQAEPIDFLRQPLFRRNVEILGKHGYTYGILVYHHQLTAVLDFVDALPEQRLVLNHMGKPDLKTFEKEEWRKNITKLAAHQHVYCKLSGLVTEADIGKWTKEMLHTHIDIAVEQFGTNRLMFGSDWPVMTLNTNYTEWATILKSYIQQFSEEEQHKILHQNAVNFYKLNL